jgi:hypothetical protein
MTVEPNLPRPEEHSKACARPQAPLVPPGDAIPPAGDIPQSQAGTAVPVDTQSPFSFGRLRPGDLLAGITSFRVLISPFFPWCSFAASVHGKHLPQQWRGLHRQLRPVGRGPASPGDFDAAYDQVVDEGAAFASSSAPGH